ncbi:MAG TPA: phosphonopyruvate decarboxylase [bacterium]|nr:phosphonopyruvate decarboxylase [bacterium]
MIAAETFFQALDARGFGPYLGVPCSYLTPFINYAIGSPRHRYLAANNEGEAVAMAAGACLAGRRPVVMFQNSGLGNTVNPLTSLAHPFRLPLLLITTQRGEPGVPDEPQHALMGRITEPLLRVLGVGCALFPDSDALVASRVAEACTALEAASLPYAFVMRKGSVAPHALTPQPAPAYRAGQVLPGAAPDAPPELARMAAIEAVAGAVPAHAALIATTGKIGRELFTCAERPGNLYVVGSMGCASSIGLGVALEQPRRPVLVLDGDGAALMRLEALASIGHYRPPGLVHVILDNGMHESTGGQASLSATVDFGAVAAACGYASAERVVAGSALRAALARALGSEGPHLIHARVQPGSAPGLGRPTLSPVEVKARFMAFLAA